MWLGVKVSSNRLLFLVVIAFATCIFSEVEANVKWSYKRNTTPATGELISQYQFLLNWIFQLEEYLYHT